MRYAAPWDRSLRVSTGVLLAVIALAGAVLAAIVLAVGAGPLVTALGGLALAVLAGVAVAAWALAPTGYAIEGGTLRVLRRLRPIEVPLAEVGAVCRIAELRAGGAARIGGSAGFFGHHGRFWSRPLGSFRLHATRTHDLVLLDLSDDRLLLSPDLPERFLEEVLAAAPRAARAEDPEALPRRPLPRRAKVELALAIAAVPVLVGAILAASVAWAPMRAEVGPTAVRIERRLAGPVVIPLARIRSAEVLGVAEGFRRVAGFQGPGLSYGRFASEELGEFRLYDWGGGAWVLLQTDDGNVVLTPDDAPGFVAAVRAGMAGR